MLVQYSDDLVDGVCSIHCLSLSLGVNIDREPKMIWGPDYGSSAETRPLLPVEQLTYLIGADLKHAMTKRSKHSFASKEVAEQFRQKHGGEFGDFNEALRRSCGRGRRTSAPSAACWCRSIQAGRPWCSTGTATRISSTAPRTSSSTCTTWPRYAPGHRREDVALIQVTDFYSLMRIDAQKAFFVVGSDVLGPMGLELVPLATRADAEDFLKDHKGRRILGFAEVTREIPYRLDEGKF